MQAECLIRYGDREYEIEMEHLHHQRFFRWSIDKLHTHPSYHLILISQGDCYLQMPDRRLIFLKHQDLLFINPNVPHLFIPNAESGVEHTSCIWRFRDRDGNYGLFPLQSLSDENDQRDYIVKELSDLEASAFQRLHRVAENYYNESRSEFKISDRANPVSLFDASSSIFKLWLTGYSLVMETNAKIPKLHTGSRHAVIEKIHKLIEMNFNLTNFSVNYLAQELHMHPNYLNTMFARETGSSIGQMIRRYRLEYAKDLLRGTTLGIADIAARSGFTRHNYFTRIFKAAMHMTPHEYRKRTTADQESF